ncbi:MAG: pyruvate, phosphate dikinase, partial [Desulfobacterales bacterium]|nr:pyruvate, phosphate dikinase [Desulfobacterales bacterium]
FFSAIESDTHLSVRSDAIDNLLLYVQTLLKDAGEEMEKFAPVINTCFDRIGSFSEDNFRLFVKSYYQIQKIAAVLIKGPVNYPADFGSINRLLIKNYRHTYDYWLSEADPLEWIRAEAGEADLPDDLENLFSDILHTDIVRAKEKLNRVAGSGGESAQTTLEGLLVLTTYNQIVERYRSVPHSLYQADSENGNGNYWKVIFLFHMMNMPGLSMIHEENLRDINRTLTWLIEHESYTRVMKLIDQTFSILKARTHDFPATALNCVLNMGKGVYKTCESELINFFVDGIIDLGFQAPMISGVGNDWQVQVNPAHLQNIRTWIELIENNPKWSPRLLSYLTIHLSLCGVFIKDTDLFPRDITRFLNSGIEPVYNLAKQLTRLFPSYFNEIGAEGRLRDISTELDELTHRKDILIHFLRKQSHVESSNLIIKFCEAVLIFWETRDKCLLESFVPPSIFEQVTAQGPYIDGVSGVIASLKDNGFNWPNDLIDIAEDDLLKLFDDMTAGTKADRRRVQLVSIFYKIIFHKYNLVFVETEQYLTQLKAEAFPELEKLQKALTRKNIRDKLSGLLGYLQGLKALIVSEQTFEVREDIYKKRHFTVDIPSMYGSYHEKKFDALGLTFRIESIANVLFEQLVADIDLSLITKATFFQIYNRLKLFHRALKLDGISSGGLERQMAILAHSLKVRGFTFTQYLDIFKGFAKAVKNITNDYFNNIHEMNLNRILDQIPLDQILPKFLPKKEIADVERVKHQVSEIFFRDRIALSLGLQQMDLFLSRILNTLFSQSNKLPNDKLQLLLNYDPQRAMMSIAKPLKLVNGIIYLGNKGKNMVKLKQYGLPVPPGFIITTEAFRCGELIEGFRPAEQNFKESLQKEIRSLERQTGKKFGTPVNPLLLSVRSGAAISQPGMLDTFLDVGVNETIVEGMAEISGNPWFAWDNYRRFLQCYGMAFNLKRDDFDAIISAFKENLGIPLKRGFTGEHMKQVALTYKQMIQDAGIEVLEEPFEQLYMMIKAVFKSWYSDKAGTYRQIMGISDDWGTAVTIQEMVFGNLSQLSGSGVFFTHNPRWSGDILKLWGDFSIENQGEDVVSGLVTTLPISMFQQGIEMRQTDITLETHFPAIYNTLKEWANDLIYEKGWSPQEMEFTFEGPGAGDLYLLQSRDMSMREVKEVATYDPAATHRAKSLGYGIGVSGGAMAGRVVFTLEEIDYWRREEPETKLILIRGDTVPDDIREVFASDGLLTARGGATSHAAVVAHRLEKTCVVGCGNLVCNEKERNCRFDENHLDSGDYISIDGQGGSVYQGQVKLMG